jgi:hypothetical protein
VGGHTRGGLCRPSIEERKKELESILQDREMREKGEMKPPSPPSIKVGEGTYTRYITSLRKKDKERKPFIVADIETVRCTRISIDQPSEVHIPYAVGFLLVRPSEKIAPDTHISTYFSEVYSIIIDSFEKRSEKVLFDFIVKLRSYVKKERHWCCYILEQLFQVRWYNYCQTPS